MSQKTEDTSNSESSPDNLANIKAAIEKCQQQLEKLPSSDPQRPQLLVDLAIHFRECYIRTKNPQDIHKALENSLALFKEASTDQDRTRALYWRAQCFKSRYRVQKSSSDIDSALDVFQELLGLISSISDPVVPETEILFDQGKSYADRFRRSGNPADLDMAIEKADVALALTPMEASDDRVTLLEALAWGCSERFRISKVLVDLDRTIHYRQQILAEVPEKHPIRTKILYRLACLSQDRWKVSQNLTDLDNALVYTGTGLSMILHDHSMQVKFLKVSAWAHYRRFREQKKDTDLNSAIKEYQRILDQIKNANELEAQFFLDFANGLGYRWTLQGDIQDLNIAIENINKGLAVVPLDPHTQLLLDEALAQCHSRKFKQSGKESDISSAITVYQRVLLQLPRADKFQSHRLFDLAKSLADRWSLLKNMQDLDHALENTQKGLAMITSNHSEWVPLNKGLAWCYAEKFRESGDQMEMTSAIIVCQTILEQNLDPIVQGQILLKLARLLTERWAFLKDVQDLDDAIEHIHKGMAVIPLDHPLQLPFEELLAGCHRDKFSQSGTESEITCCIKSYQNILQQAPENYKYKGHVFRDLAHSLADRWLLSKDIQDLDDAIKNTEQGLDVIPSDHPLQVHLGKGLAWCYQQKFLQSSNETDITAAITEYQRILQTYPESRFRGQLLFELAGSFADRWSLLKDVQDLNATIVNTHKGLSLLPPAHPLQIRFGLGLAWCHRAKFSDSKDQSYLARAIQKYQEMLDHIPMTNEKARHETQLGLAKALATRYYVFTELRDLEDAIQTIELTLHQIPPKNPIKIQMLQELASNLYSRYLRLGDITDLDKAIQWLYSGLSDTISDHDQGMVLNKLAVCFTTRYRKLQDTKDLDLAIAKNQLAQQSFLATKPSFDVLHTTARHMWMKYLDSEDLKYLDTALETYQQSLASGLPDHQKIFTLYGLAVCLRARYHKLKDFSDLTEATARLQESMDVMCQIDPNHPFKPDIQQQQALCSVNKYEKLGRPEYLESAWELFTTSFQAVTMKDPENQWHTALEWAVTALRHRPQYSLFAFQSAFRLIPDLLWIGKKITFRHEDIRRLNIGNITAHAARVSIQLERWDIGVQIIEQGIATVFQQTLQLRPDIGSIPGPLGQEFQALSMELYTGASDNPRLTAIRRKVVMDKIRAQPEHKEFMCPKSYESLCHAAQVGPVIILNCHQDHAAAMIILNPTEQHPAVVSFPHVTAKVLDAKQTLLKDLMGFFKVRNPGSVRLGGGREGYKSKTVEQSFADLLLWLWQGIVDPVYQILACHGIHTGRLWWLPTGAFTGLPLHACAQTSDPFIHSYTPTLGSLIEARAKKVVDHKPTIGLVAVSHTGSTQENFLKSVKEEADKISYILRSQLVSALHVEQATVAAVRAQLENCSWVHLACHGVQDSAELTKSRLLLYQGNLELETILKMPLPKAEFVFLSACQTAMGDAELVNESFHLGGGFIAAGFRSVVGTLWSIQDEDGPVVAELFYSHLFQHGHQPHVSDTAEALHFAVKELRARNVPYERWIPFIHMGV